MPRQLKVWLGEKIPCEMGCTPGAGKTLCNLRLTHSLCHLAELGSTLFGATAVCEQLGIHEYAELSPEPQHRYLAYFVREGLISEIITTNYDCCLETALSQSFLPGEDRSRIGVVRNFEEYRQEGSRHTAVDNVLLHKINGCAGAYSLAREAYDRSKTTENKLSWDAEARRIVLTERQLQSFRDQSWAQDIIRDRFRRRRLFFSGFGNDEPQVRHTVLALISEFMNGERNSSSPEAALDLPNAPFLHSFNGTLSFNQLQMLVAFVDAHSEPQLPTNPPSRRIEPVYRNVLGPGTQGSTLPASDLMGQLFRRVLLGLVSRSLRDGEPFVVWLSEILPEWRAWVGTLRRVFDPSRRGGFRIMWDRFLLPDPATPRFEIPLYRYLWAILYPDQQRTAQHGGHEGWYLPLRDDPLLILLTVQWLAFFYRRKRPPKPTAFGLRLALRSGGNVHLVARNALRELQQDGDGVAEPNNRLLRMIVIPTLRKDADAWGRWRIERDGRLRAGRWIAVDSADIVREARRPGAVVATLANAFAAVTPRRPVARLLPIDR